MNPNVNLLSVFLIRFFIFRDRSIPQNQRARFTFLRSSQRTRGSSWWRHTTCTAQSSARLNWPWWRKRKPLSESTHLSSAISFTTSTPCRESRRPLTVRSLGDPGPPSNGERSVTADNFILMNLKRVEFFIVGFNFQNCLFLVCSILVRIIRVIDYDFV